MSTRAMVHARAEAPPAPEARAGASTAPLPERAAWPARLVPSRATSAFMPVGVGAAIKHYELIRELGRGGMGTVFLARDTKLGRLVAIKLLHEYSGDKAERFLAEARATARCRHENIVVIHEVDEFRGYPYMVLEYIEGRTLRDWMAHQEPGSMSSSQAIELMIPVVRALVRAHQFGIVHRDLKPENILLDDAGPIKVLDFGIAKQIDAKVVSTITDAHAALAEGARKPREEMILGTPPYMSPEQLLGRDIDARADLWAVGIVFYELLTEAHPLEPFSFARLSEIVALDVPMPGVREKRPDVGALGAVIDRCLKKRKAERMGSAQELLAALEALLPGKKPLSLREDESPFAGLTAFQEADAARFFGRDRDIAAVTRWLGSQPLVAVAGPSGAGKSSFVRAGVIPALKRSGDGWEAFLLRPGRQPLSALVDVLVQVAETAGSAENVEHDRLIATLRAQPGSMGARLRARCRRGGPRRRILLFVDPFEELYTLGATPEERAVFVACLEGAADDASSPLRVLLAIRSDFLDRMAEERHFMTDVTRGLWFLPPLGRDSLREALTRPVEASGHRFQTEEMVEHVLFTLESTRSPLPLLQFTAAKLWEARDPERRLLTQEGYEKLGGVAGALSTHADAVLSALPSHEQRLARAILLRLITPERTRAVVGMDELCELAQGGAGDGQAIVQVVQHLADARLLLIEVGGEREGKTVELVHESLIDRWGKLRQWLTESEQDAHFLARLRAAAQPWESSGHADGLLWRDHAAEQARQWYERRRAEGGVDWNVGLGKREERYLLAVVALSERARRLRRRIAMGVIATLGAIAVVVSYLALRASNEAAHAQVEARNARNATRMAAARELQTDHTTVVALLREIEPPDVPREWSALARWALHSGVAPVVLGQPGGITYASYGPDGKRIVTGSHDHTARVWNADGTGEPLVLRGHEDIVHFAAWSPDGKHIVTASADKTVRVWNADGTGEPLVLRGHEGKVDSAAWSPDGKRIVSGSYDKTARVWNVDGTGEPLIFRGHGDTIHSAAWSPDGKRIVTASWDKTVRVWNADGTGKPLILRGHKDGVMGAAWSPDGKRIVTASYDKTARVWNANGTGEPLVLRGHDEGVTSAAWSPDGKRVVTSSQDKTVRVWNADGTGEPWVLRGHGDRVDSTAWSPDGKHIVTTSYDKTARVWNAESTGALLVLRGHGAGAVSPVWSPDGKRIVTGSYDNTARVWNADGTGEPLLLRHPHWVLGVAFCPDGKRIVTASQDKTARVWNLDGAGEPRVLRGHEREIHSVAWSPDGKRIVTGSADDTARVWNADGTGEPLVLRGLEDVVRSAAWSPDGKRIVTASQDDTARVWNVDGTGAPVILRGHEHGIRSAAWSPDGKRIVTASSDKTVRVWNADGTGEPLVLRGHEHWVRSVAWSSDSKRIVSGSQDGTARVWNADGTGDPLVLRGSDSSVNGVAFSPDGRRIVTTSGDGTVRVWTDLEPLRGIDDPKLWTATTYCMPIERRMELLRVTEAMARADREACVRRVDLHLHPAHATLRRPRGDDHAALR
ncbi:MAG TPA: protein kinase [Polyangium sp.]|nr:protein kinase [Polyangium sp.]